jgi:hypothetical protein
LKALGDWHFGRIIQTNTAGLGINVAFYGSIIEYHVVIYDRIADG